MRRILVLVAGTVCFLAGSASSAHAAEPVLSAKDVTVAENSTAGKAVVKLQLDRAAKRRIPIGWKTVARSATGADFVADKGTVTFRAGDRARKVAIRIKNDALDEGAENFRVVLSGTKARIPDKVVVVKITDDDPLPSLSAGTRTVTEGGRGTRTPAPIALTLSKRSGRTVKVSWAVTSKSATAGTDVVGKGTVSIPAGKTSVPLPAQVIGDNVAEGNQVAVITLRSPVNARVLRHGRVTVTDDDDPATSTDLEVRLATARAATKTFTAYASDGVTLDGGVVQATGADGTTYQLTVPDGALMAPTTITMTPWTAVEGVSVSGGRLVGVDLKPNGLELLEGATLLVTPPGGGDVGAVSFAYVNNGREAHHYPLALDPSQLSFNISHFSGYGSYVGDNISIPVAPAPPTDPAQALSAEIALLVAEERQRQLEGDAPDPEVWETIQLYLTSYYDRVVAPMLPSIRTDCTYAKANNATVLGWARSTALAFGGGQFETHQQTVLDAVVAGAENCLNELLEPCVDATDGAQMRDIYSAWRIVLLFGGTVPDPAPDDASHECKTRLLGSLTVQHDSVTLISGRFRHEEHYTLTFHPVLDSGWYDDGTGSWNLTGTYEYDNLPVSCDSYDIVYSGEGSILPRSYLGPYPQEGDASFYISGFHPTYDYGWIPRVDGDVVGSTHRTDRDLISGNCEERQASSTKWFGVPPCPTLSGSVEGTQVTDPAKGRGVKFDCTRSLYESTDTKEQTGSVSIKGQFWLVKT